MRTNTIAIALLLLLRATGSAGEPVITSRVLGDFPTTKLSAIASGSGLQLSPTIVITNRHVVEHRKGKYYDGFKVAFGPSYAEDQAIAARLLQVADNYDLALIELKTSVPMKPFPIAKSLAPLGTKVRAFGFPLGSSFGVGITVSGGQISRHPIASADKKQDSDENEIRLSLWHDATIASGSSGGPLFTETGALAGLNFAQLTKSKHALAVPSDVVIDFVSKSASPCELQIVDGVDKLNEFGTDSITKQVVFIESMGDVSKFSEAPSFTNELSDLKKAATHLVRVHLAQFDARTLGQAVRGNLGYAFQPQSPLSITTGKLIRIRSSMLILQILEEGMLCEFGDVRCFILLPNGGELKAKLGGDIKSVDSDDLYLAGEPTEYETKGGESAFFIPLVRVIDVLSPDQVVALAKVELEKRSQETREKALAQQKQHVATLSRTFNDKTGKFSVDAVCIEFKDNSVTLFNTANRKTVVVNASVLSESDQEWLKANASKIKVGGKLAKGYLENQEK